MKSLSIGKHILRTKSSPDTIAWARSHWRSEQDGTVFFAENLERARGRQGRSWEWQAGQLTLTILLKPGHMVAADEDDINHLTMAMATALCRAFHPQGVVIKWPNDLYLNNKKIGGVLIESLWHDGRIQAFIMGFSINVNNRFDPDHYLAKIATSIIQETHLSCDLALLQEVVLTTLSTWYDAWKAGEYETIYAAWHECQGYLGKEISVHRKDGVLLHGIAKDVLANGDLLMLIDGRKETIPFYLVEEVKI